MIDVHNRIIQATIKTKKNLKMMMQDQQERSTRKSEHGVESRYEPQASGDRLPLSARSMISSAPKWNGKIGFAFSHRAWASTESS